MIDLHTHSLFSDGELTPAELARRFEVAGYKALAITDPAGRLQEIVVGAGLTEDDYQTMMKNAESVAKKCLT